VHLPTTPKQSAGFIVSPYQRVFLDHREEIPVHHIVPHMRILLLIVEDDRVVVLGLL
jgi:hypothetical protein